MDIRPCQGSGLWNAYPINYSTETQNLLKLMMNESKLTNLQQRNINEKMISGKVLPVQISKKNVIKENRIKNSKYLTPKNYLGGVRSKETIEKMEESHIPSFRRIQVKSRNNEKEKDRLANIMAFGNDLKDKNNGNGQSLSNTEKIEPSRKEVDRFDELLNEIGDRRNFLETMSKIGKADQYRANIETEISKLILEMEIIDKKRTKELEFQLKEQI